MNGVAARYKKVQVNTCAPAQVLVMLYDGIMRFASEAEAAMRRDDRATAGERIGRCLAILEELDATLDTRHAPELCDNLRAIYGFARRRLTEANLQRNPALLGEIRPAIEPLREAFATIALRG